MNDKLSKKTPRRVADFLAVNHPAGVSRFEVTLARLICEGLDAKGLSITSKFTWSEIFTDGEIAGGVISQIPNWFVETKSAEPTDFQKLSEQFFVVFVGPGMSGELIRFVDRLIDSAVILKEAGVGPGVALRSEDGSSECVITAMSSRKVFGHWIKGEDNRQSPRDGERVLHLNRHNWRVI